jgi:hypothetical protein
MPDQNLPTARRIRSLRVIKAACWHGWCDVSAFPGRPSADVFAAERQGPVPSPAKFPTMNSSWLKIGPEALYWGAAGRGQVWNVSDIYITENGCSATAVPAADGLVYDTDRIMFLRSCLTQLQRATSEGLPERGYFYWSLMDNFECADGFGSRFGLLYVDYATQQRMPKLSASFYREGAVRNRLVLGEGRPRPANIPRQPPPSFGSIATPGGQTSLVKRGSFRYFSIPCHLNTRASDVARQS